MAGTVAKLWLVAVALDPLSLAYAQVGPRPAAPLVAADSDSLQLESEAHTPGDESWHASATAWGARIIVLLAAMVVVNTLWPTRDA